MAGTPLELPAFIQMRYAENGVFSTLKSEAANVTGVVRRDFEQMAGAVGKSFQAVTGASRSAMGALNSDDMRRAIDLQNAKTRAAEEYAAAARRAANADAGQTRELQEAAAAAEVMAMKEREAAAAAAVRASVIGRVEAELNRETTATESAIAAYRRLAVANDNSTRSAGSHRMAMVGLGQQMQDAVIQAQMGTSALTIFAQQGSQAAYQMAGMGGAVGRVASVMAGPWGAAIFAGTALLGPLIVGLADTSEAMDDVKFSSDAMGDAQGILGNVLDITTGKITTQRSELIALARAQLIVARLQSQKREAEARGAITQSTKPAWYISGGMGGGFDIGRRRGIQAQVGRDYLAGRSNTDEAVQQLELLRNEGKLTTEQFEELAAAYANLGVEIANQKLYDQGLELLDGTGGRNLLKPKKTKADHSAEKAAREAERLQRFGDKAAESVARINERFDAAPKFIDQAAQATRKLDAIIADIDAKLAKGGLGKAMADDLEKTRAEAEAAKDTVRDALVRPLEDARKASEQRLAVQELLAQGRDDEAAGLQAVYGLEQQLGDEEMLRARVQDLITAGRKEEAAALQSLVDQYPDLKRQASDLAVIEAERSRELARQRDLFEAQIDVLTTAKSGLTDLLSGRKTDLFGDIGQALRYLQGARLSEQLFGGVFRELENELRRRSPLGKATDRLVTGVDTANTSIGSLASATELAAQRIMGAANAMAVNDNGYIDTATGNIVVTRTTDGGNSEVELATLSVQQLAERTAHGIVDPLTAKLDEMLGTRFFQGLSGVLSGALGGYMTGGVPGGVLGALRGGVFDYGPDIFGKGTTEKLLGGFDKALGGAQTGTMTAGIMKSLGLKTSTTGSQIGGAIGSFIPIPGGEILGSIAGGLLGGLFKKTKWARVLLGSGGNQLQSNSGKYEDAVTAAGDSFNQSLANIADALGGSLGNYGGITLGVRHGDWRVNTGGTSLKKKNGAKDFDEDQEAAMKYAIMTAIDRGAIAGIRASTQRLLKAGNDLDAALQDALDWENAFKELQAYKDPVGAALDGLNREFEKLIDLADKAGASAEEMAQLEELYGIKRAEIIKEQNERLIGSLKDLYTDLTTGDNGLSLRDRRANAMSEYDALKARVDAGDTTAYDDYAAAARNLLDIERQLYGSQQEYFDRLNEVTGTTKGRIDAETNVISIAENRDSPFDSAGRVNASIADQTDVLGSYLAALNVNVGSSNAMLAAILAAVSNGNPGASARGLAFANNF
ncbi:MAG: phage tail length tape measure family protein [Novosphingobium sp.]